MHRISCSVNPCAYNHQGLCGASVLKIGGDGARITEATHCETYVNRNQYSNSLDQNVTSGETQNILCGVRTCAYHSNSQCTLREIEISSLKEAETYHETDCLSFERR